MHQDALKKLMKKKEAHGMSDAEKSAKTSVLEHMRDMAHSMMGEKLKGMKKVTVASPSAEGLDKGLDTAREMLSAHKSDPKAEMEDAPESLKEAMDKPEHADADEPADLDAEAHEGSDETDHSEDHSTESKDASPFEGEETPEEEAAEEDSDMASMSADELDAKIKKLQEHRKKLHG